MSVDPIADGLNWYVYCENNPLVFVDPSGLEGVGSTTIDDYENQQLIKKRQEEASATSSPEAAMKNFLVSVPEVMSQINSEREVLEKKLREKNEQEYYRVMDAYNRYGVVNTSDKDFKKLFELQGQYSTLMQFLDVIDENVYMKVVFEYMKTGKAPEFQEILDYTTEAIKAKNYMQMTIGTVTMGMIVYSYMMPSPAVEVDEARRGVNTLISAQKQARHVEGTNQWNQTGQKGYFTNTSDAQKVLDAFHANNVKILGNTSNGNIVVRYNGVTGYNNNPGAGFLNQSTNVFMIKGTESVSIVPINPTWGQ